MAENEAEPVQVHLRCVLRATKSTKPAQIRLSAVRNSLGKTQHVIGCDANTVVKSSPQRNEMSSRSCHRRIRLRLFAEPACVSPRPLVCHRSVAVSGMSIIGRRRSVLGRLNCRMCIEKFHELNGLSVPEQPDINLGNRGRFPGAFVGP